MSEITIFQADNGTVEVRVAQETVWLSQEQMANVFGVQKAAISKHLKNIFASGELEREATVSKMETVAIEGEREVKRQIEHFNLDAVIFVGYRVNSTRATRFRQWATQHLRKHLTQGYTINRELEAALLLVRKAAQFYGAHRFHWVDFIGYVKVALVNRFIQSYTHDGVLC